MASFLLPDPGPLSDDEIELRLAETDPGNPTAGVVPWYRFHIIQLGTGRYAGHLSLRIGDSEHIQRYAGHIGYRVHPAFRGQGYAGRACRLIADFARAHGYATLWITCSPATFPRCARWNVSVRSSSKRWTCRRTPTCTGAASGASAATAG